LGEDYQKIIDDQGNLIGNVTLIPEKYEIGSNQNFLSKKDLYKKTGFGLNKYFKNIPNWNADEIRKRSEVLADKALEVWGFFGIKLENSFDNEDVTGKKPESITFMGETYEVNSWKEVLGKTITSILFLDRDKIKILAEALPRIFSTDSIKFSREYEVSDGYYLNVYLSAREVLKYCKKAIILVELYEDDWSVKLRN
jgi:hypothetical protein